MRECFKSEYEDKISDFCKGVCEYEVETLSSGTVLYCLMKYYISVKDAKDFYDASDKMLKAGAVYITYKNAGW